MIWASPLATLELRSDQVDVWRISLDLPIAVVKRLEASLSADEALRAARFHFPADKDRFIVAHGCLRDILARYLHCGSTQLNFYTNDYGKPALEKHQLEFNLSHSGDFALVAVTRERKIGVDVEQLRANIELEDIANRYFSPNEVAELMATQPAQRRAAFFACWSHKEAYIKAQGLGLSLPLDSFDVSLAPNGSAQLRATRPEPLEAAQWTLLTLDVDPCYAAAVAVKGRGLEFKLWNWKT
jgi:4'-phosphopantetheinyl transferase